MAPDCPQSKNRGQSDLVESVLNAAFPLALNELLIDHAERLLRQNV